jgi:hypothetical protein
MSTIRTAHPRLAALALLALMMLSAPAGVAWAESGNASLQGTQASCEFFPETGNSICNGFYRYWQANGGLRIFGLPITGEFTENGMTVQYTQRARFEWHPGSDPAQWDVELGQLGTESRNMGSMDNTMGDDLSGALDMVKASVTAYTDVNAAITAGYGLVPGLDYCFNNPGVGGMGIHYINTNILDTSTDPLKPEAMVYQKDANGNLTLGAVEWIVPTAAWDAEAPSADIVPEVMGHKMHRDDTLGVYMLHAWIFKNNPSGVFADWNPDVTCP